MAGLILSFLVDYLGQRVVARSRRDKAELPAHDLIASHAHRREAVGLYVLEAGIIFHSISKAALGPLLCFSSCSVFPS